MEAHPTRKVISRHYQDGQALDVAGLNRFTLLVDRSETALTEVGWNYWKPGLDGPPHFHEAKEQFFFATDGQGVVTIAGHEYHLQPNNLLHVPMGAMHRTIVIGDSAHAYLLVNAFRDVDKEGKANFSDHLAESKHIRRRQADEAAQGAVIDWDRNPVTGTLVQVDPSLPLVGTSEERLLIALGGTLRLSAGLLRLGAGRSRALEHDASGVECTLFGLAGAGLMEAGDQTYAMSAGTVVYLPPGIAATAHAGEGGLVCLSVLTHLASPPVV